MIDLATPIYERVALEFAIRLNKHFTSEDTLHTLFAKHFPALAFDRTKHWDQILRRELNEVWKEFGPVVKANITRHDTHAVLSHLAGGLDYNIYSQVLLNLQDQHFRYSEISVEKVLASLKSEWEGKSPSPFEPKAKMIKTAADADEARFNHTLSQIKALSIISSLPPSISFRVSPKGATPALVDSANLSMLGVGGDRFLTIPPHFEVAYLTWDEAPQILVGGESEASALTFATDFIPYSFTSKSGGDILNSTLFARYVATALAHFLRSFQVSVLPRMTSVMLVTDSPRSLIEETKVILDNHFPGVLTLHWDARTANLPGVAAA